MLHVKFIQYNKNPADYLDYEIQQEWFSLSTPFLQMNDHKSYQEFFHSNCLLKFLTEHVISKGWLVRYWHKYNAFATKNLLLPAKDFDPKFMSF